MLSLLDIKVTHGHAGCRKKHDVYEIVKNTISFQLRHLQIIGESPADAFHLNDEGFIKLIQTKSVYSTASFFIISRLHFLL